MGRQYNSNALQCDQIWRNFSIAFGKLTEVYLVLDKILNSSHWNPVFQSAYHLKNLVKWLSAKTRDHKVVSSNPRDEYSVVNISYVLAVKF